MHAQALVYEEKKFIGPDVKGKVTVNQQAIQPQSGCCGAFAG
jgi:hypothetical protein